MALIELKCVKCGKVSEELIKSDGKYPKCECGGKLEQVYSGKCYTARAGSGGGCGGNCSTCKGCK